MNTVKKYKHCFVILSYFIVYMIAFYYLENRRIYVYHIIHTTFDSYIPFCEYFIVPYLLWFPYMFIGMLYFIFINKNIKEYYQLTINLCMGMTVFLIVSYLYPNIQYLRPDTFTRDNIFVHMVETLYSTDTPTNILPSIHVFNSLAMYMAINTSESLQKYKALRRGSLVLTILIILSTMFLKQHSIIDVLLGATMALGGYLLFYHYQVRQRVKNPNAAYHSVR